MKKIILILMVMLSSLSFMSAQDSYYSNKLTDNWFVGAGAGANMYLGPNDQHAQFFDRLTVAPNIMVGKWWSPYIGTRLNVKGGPLHTFSGENGEQMNRSEYFTVTGDVLFDVTSMVKGYSSDRFYNLIPYAGVGYGKGFYNDWHSRRCNVVTVDAGVMQTFRLSNRISVYADLGVNAVEKRLDVNPDGDFHWNFIANGSAGLILKIGKTDFDKIKVYNQSEVDDLNAQVNIMLEGLKEFKAENTRLKEEVNTLSQRPVTCPEVQPQELIVNNGLSVVTFKIGKSNVTAKQEVTIYEVAELANSSGGQITIIGYADAETGSKAINEKLSEQRAKNVASLLVNKYGVDSSQVSIQWKGASEQPYKENSWNRVAILITE